MDLLHDVCRGIIVDPHGGKVVGALPQLHMEWLYPSSRHWIQSYCSAWLMSLNTSCSTWPSLSLKSTTSSGPSLHKECLWKISCKVDSVLPDGKKSLNLFAFLLDTDVNPPNALPLECLKLVPLVEDPLADSGEGSRVVHCHAGPPGRR